MAGCFTDIHSQIIKNNIRCLLSSFFVFRHKTRTLWEFLSHLKILSNLYNVSKNIALKELIRNNKSVINSSVISIHKSNQCSFVFSHSKQGIIVRKLSPLFA